MTDADIKTYIQNQISSAIMVTSWTNDTLAIAKTVLIKGLTDLVSQGVSDLPFTTVLSIDGGNNLVYTWGY